VARMAIRSREQLGVIVTEMVKQRSERDCYLCCVAMAVNVPYENICTDLTRAELSEMSIRGTVGDLIDRVWAIVGMRRDLDFRSGFYGHLSTLDPKYGPSTIRDFLWGRRALIQVPSLNFEGEMHIVYWDGFSLFDPSTKLKYEKLEELPMTGYITWFNEVNK
jgi:hypothetical protein